VYDAGVSKRLNIMLPDATVKLLDRVAPKGDRSRFISQAVLHYVETRSAAHLRERLKQGALANAKLDLEIAGEWFPAEQEAWQKLTDRERSQKSFPAAAKSTSRSSTRR
jgi:CopG family transcriptional regulator/antitoxin EndoAI